MSETAKHLASGTVAGLTAKIVEYPFDTVKVRVQTNPDKYNKGYVHCAKQIYFNEGFWSFYKGIGAPMIGGGLENAVCFSAYAFGLKSFGYLFAKSPEERVALQKAPSAGAIVWSGLCAGFAVSFVLTPVELLKCNMQVQNLLPKEERKYKNVGDCAIKMIRAGGIGALLRGHTATLAREVPGNASWFGFYNLTKYALTPAGQTVDELPLWKLMLAGGVGGVTYWTAFFPADVVKTKMQIDPEFAKMGLLRGLGHQYKAHGIVKGLYAGWGITAVRAFPANAIIFSMYEVCAGWWDQYFDVHDFPQK